MSYLYILLRLSSIREDKYNGRSSKIYMLIIVLHMRMFIYVQ